MIDLAQCVRDEPLAAGQQRRLETTAWAMSVVASHLRQWAVLRETVREEWVPADEAQDWLLRGRYTGRRRWLRGSHRSGVKRGFGESFLDEPPWELRAPFGDYAAADERREPARRPGCWQVPTQAFFDTLPRDPDRLLERLRAASPSHVRSSRHRLLRFPGYVGPWVYAMDLLRTGRVPADLRAAVYGALQLLPTVRVVKGAATLDGAAAVALVLDLSPIRHELFVDPADGHYVGTRDTVTAWNPVFQMHPGTVIVDEASRTSVVDGIATSRVA